MLALASRTAKTSLLPPRTLARYTCVRPTPATHLATLPAGLAMPKRKSVLMVHEEPTTASAGEVGAEPAIQESVKKRRTKKALDGDSPRKTEPGSTAVQVDDGSTVTPTKERWNVETRTSGKSIPSSSRRRGPEAVTQPDGNLEATPVRRSSRPRKPVKASEDLENAEATRGETHTSKKRRKKTDEPIVYDIPPVSRRETTFRGRLGYACLNTILRAQKPDSVFCSRTCRLETIAQKGIEFVKDLGLKNAGDLYRMIEWNETNKIRFLRISSDLFPFASHSVHGYSLAFAQSVLGRAGELARSLGHRLTLHPGQFTQLGSNKEAVIKASVRELDYQCEILDRMGMGADSVMIVHMGGVYGDKSSTVARFKETYNTLLSEGVKKRLVLENDELCYNVDDLLPISEELGIPIVLDYHHDWIYPSSRPVSELIPLINAVWERRGIKPKQHLSSPRAGAVTAIEKRAHADRCDILPEALPEDMDLMIEAKDKEQAVFHLWRIYGLEEPIWENLRPPAAVQELATKGRKSSKTKKKQLGDPDVEGT